MAYHRRDAYDSFEGVDALGPIGVGLKRTVEAAERLPGGCSCAGLVFWG